MKKLITTLTIIMTAMTINAKTLIVYYSYTNNVERIVNELHSQIDADVIEIEPAEKGLDYAANNYAIGSAQIAAIRSNPDKASSYPAIDAVNADLSQYSTIIIGAPLWWSNMAAPLQTFLFHHGKEMAGKNIGLIVSSASSGINGVEGDAKRLIPSGKFLSPSLWIRSSQTSNAATMISNWLNAIGYKNLSGIDNIESDASDEKVIAMYNLSGQEITDHDRASSGIYIVKSMVDNRIITKKVAMTIR
ncbi:MAG: hypothetical protein J6B44_02125 [Muribaculaceae bacterium]|nr:hypothetical protein [Muribaculaceae bacterium]